MSSQIHPDIPNEAEILRRAHMARSQAVDTAFARAITALRQRFARRRAAQAATRGLTPPNGRAAA